MNVLGIAGRKLVGLFVDDLAFALAIAGWIAVALILLPFVDPATRGPLLFAGFGIIFIASVARGRR